MTYIIKIYKTKKVTKNHQQTDPECLEHIESIMIDLDVMSQIYKVIFPIIDQNDETLPV